MQVNIFIKEIHCQEEKAIYSNGLIIFHILFIQLALPTNMVKQLSKTVFIPIKTLIISFYFYMIMHVCNKQSNFQDNIPQ